ncbi:NACHT domain-containing protein [Embleya sp. NPDC050154]|uniref:NACHT domain-containing protein n=1 Tax=unclassified Embleya TaxID=2699296 RepID=UPI0037A02CCF
MGTHGGRKVALAWALVCLVAVVVAAVWGLRGVKPGDDFDPIGALGVLFGTGVAVWSGLMTRAALRQQAPNLAFADDLARQVKLVETAERARMLGEDSPRIDVRFVLRPAARRSAAGAGSEGRLSTVVDYYAKLRPRRLVITGAPGAGKTVLAIELVLGLLDLERKASDPVPVRMSLASWSTLPDAVPVTVEAAGAAVRSWVCAHLVRNYRITSVVAKALVEAGLILPVLDGLDEMDAEDPGPNFGRGWRALEVLNAYQHGREKAGLVLTCRSGPYDGLQVWAKDAARVEIVPVTFSQARQFIFDRVDDRARWRNVTDTLDREPFGSVARVLSTPWRLMMAVTVHEQRDARGFHLPQFHPDNLLSPRPGGEAAMRHHLNRLFVLAATTDQLARDGRRPGYTPAQVHTWLGVLAGYLRANTVTWRHVGGRTLSGTDMILHEMWPLAGPRRPRAVHGFLCAVPLGLGMLLLTALFDRFEFSAEKLQGAGTVAAICGVGVACAWYNVWPSPAYLSPLRIRPRHGGPTAVERIAGGLTIGVEGAVILRFLYGYTDVTVSVAIALIALLITGHESAGRVGFTNPRNLIRSDVAAWLGIGFACGAGLLAYIVMGWVGEDAMGLVLGLVCTLGMGFGFALAARFGVGTGSGVEVAARLAAGLVPALALVLAVAPQLRPGLFDWALAIVRSVVLVALLAGGMLLCVNGFVGGAGVRYLALLLCTRRGPRRLPWRLGRFLAWATDAGLLRVSGTAYQFRHRELQEWLADNPTPPPAP